MASSLHILAARGALGVRTDISALLITVQLSQKTLFTNLQIFSGRHNDLSQPRDT